MEWIADKMVEGFNKAFSFLTQQVKSIYDGIIQFFTGVWQWVYQPAVNFFALVRDSVAGIYEFLGTCLWSALEWVVEFVLWCGVGLFEWGLWLLDKIAQFLMEVLFWLLERLPAANVPGAFQQGLTYFIQFAKVLDEVLPIHECFLMVSIYLVAALMVAIVDRLMNMVLRWRVY